MSTTALPADLRPRRTRLTDEVLAAQAAYILRGNDLGSMTTAAPRLYPHMWSWDAAFIAIGIARLNVERAITEVDTLLGAQWSTGMLPHIVFSDEDAPYFPGPQRWNCATLARAAPQTPATSGICQPPVHAIAVKRILETARHRGRTERQAGTEFLERAWGPLVRWHRWLAETRDPDQTGRVTVHHGWESGMDNSPRWDSPYSRVEVPKELPPYQRIDTTVVSDTSTRPSDGEYDRYLWLIEEMARVGYDDAQIRRTSSFAVEDVFTSAILAMACEALAELGESTPGHSRDVHDLRAWAARFRTGVAQSVDPRTGLARDRDVRTGEWLSSDTLAGFAPLLCGGLDRPAELRLTELLDSPQWCGHPSLVTAVPPSTAVDSPHFRQREYWRGPQWPVMAWLFSWAFAERGWPDRAALLRDEGLKLIGDGTFAEYYDPLTGEPLGSASQSWTAAAALDWLC